MSINSWRGQLFEKIVTGWPIRQFIYLEHFYTFDSDEGTDKLYWFHVPT